MKLNKILLAILLIEGCLFCFHFTIKAEAGSIDNADLKIDVQTEEDKIKSVIAEYGLAIQNQDFKKIYTELWNKRTTRSGDMERFISIGEANAKKEKITDFNIVKVTEINESSASAILVVNFDNNLGVPMFRVLTMKVVKIKEKSKDKKANPEFKWKIEDLLQDSVAFKYQQNLIRTIYIQNHPELNQKTRDAIEKGEVFIGMSQDDVVASWGEPLSKSYYISSSGRADGWEYGNKSLNFFNGKLESIFSHDD